MKKLLAVVVGALCLVGAPRPSHAFNSPGHMTVAEVAWAALDKTDVQKTITDLLDSHPYKNQDLQRDKLHKDGHDEVVFALAATWPDMIKHFGDRTDDFHHFYADYAKKFGREHEEPKKFDSALRKWHFVDVPMNQEKTDGPIVRGTIPTLTGGKAIDAIDNAFEAMDWALDMLRHKERPADMRAIALCWVAHLVGDLHQPLHCAKLFSEQFPAPKGDIGGNAFFVKSAAGNTNLHTFWDDLLGKSEFPPAVAGVAKDLLGLKKELPNFIGKPETGELDTDVAHWVDWSSQLALTKAYQQNSKPLKAATDEKAPSPPPFPAKYEEEAATLVRARADIGGLRLAEILKANLK